MERRLGFPFVVEVTDVGVGVIGTSGVGNPFDGMIIAGSTTEFGAEGVEGGGEERLGRLGGFDNISREARFRAVGAKDGVDWGGCG